MAATPCRSNEASVAGLLMTTETAVAEKRKKEKLSASAVPSDEMD